MNHDVQYCGLCFLGAPRHTDACTHHDHVRQLNEENGRLRAENEGLRRLLGRVVPDSPMLVEERRDLLGASPSVSDGGSPPRQQGVDAGSPGGAAAPSLPGATSPTPSGTAQHSTRWGGDIVAARDALGLPVPSERRASEASPDNLCTWCRKPMTGHPMVSCIGEASLNARFERLLDRLPRMNPEHHASVCAEAKAIFVEAARRRHADEEPLKPGDRVRDLEPSEWGDPAGLVGVIHAIAEKPESDGNTYADIWWEKPDGTRAFLNGRPLSVLSRVDEPRTNEASLSPLLAINWALPPTDEPPLKCINCGLSSDDPQGPPCPSGAGPQHDWEEIVVPSAEGDGVFRCGECDTPNRIGQHRPATTGSESSALRAEPTPTGSGGG